MSDGVREPTADPVIAMYAQDGAGLGHLRRCANLAEAFLSRHPTAHAVITSRSIWPAATLGLPERCDVLKLPAFAPLGTDGRGERRVLVDREDPVFVRLRSSLFLALLDALRPAVVFVDNEPLGLQRELAEPLGEARSRDLIGRVVCGLRDIRGRPEYVTEKWRRNGNARALEELYDEVLIFGDGAFFDTAALYGFGSTIAVTPTYVGYVFADRPSRSEESVRNELGVEPGQPLVAVTAGSGADGFDLLRRYLESAAPHLPDDAMSVVVAGPLMPAGELSRLLEMSSDACPVVRTFDAVSLVHAADAVVCRGGYNSVCEAVHAGHKPLVVPRVTASGEQEARAEAFAARGAVWSADPGNLTGEVIAERVEDQLSRGRASESPFRPGTSAAFAAERLAG